MRGILRVVLFNVLLTVALLAALEAIAALVVGRGPAALQSSYRLNHVWKPYTRLVHDEWVAQNPDFPQPYEHVFNAQGWLERYDVEPHKPPNVFRIFYLGDSFIEATAPMEASVPSLVERALVARTTAAGPRVEVINTGTTSYSPTIYYVLLRDLLANYAPDLIVLNIDLTDDFDDWKYQQTVVRDAAGNPWAVPPRDLLSSAFVDTATGAREASWRDGLELWLYRHSRLYAWMRLEFATETGLDVTLDSEADALYPRWAWCEVDDSPETLAQREYSLGLVRRIVALTRAKGVPLVLTATPYYAQYAGKPDGSGEPLCSSRLHEALAQLAASESLPYIDAYSRLAASVPGTPQTRYYYHGDVHFNPRGYALWAEAHIDFLADPANGLLPPAWLRQ